jgi:transcriptional regulator with XRE-family HTH domain
MPYVQDPSVEKRRLRLALRRARQEAGLTQKQAAESLEWSREKVLRIEKGAVSVQPTDVRALLQAYGISDVDEYVEMSRRAKEPGWSEYRDIYAQDYINYLGYEAVASVIRQYHPSLVPGLLQTDEYAQEIFTKVHDNSAKTVRRRRDARLRRQELLEAGNGPEFHFILDETALRRRVGSVRVMQDQIRRLQEINQRSNVHLRVLPFTVGAHPGMRGPFILLEFDDPTFDDVLFMENPRGDYMTRDEADVTAEYFETFGQLEKLSLGDADFDRFVGEIAAEKGSSG